MDLRVGESPTRKGPGNATEKDSLKWDWATKENRPLEGTLSRQSSVQGTQ